MMEAWVPGRERFMETREGRESCYNEFVEQTLLVDLFIKMVNPVARFFSSLFRVL
jgi:hypothetical protein